MDVVLQKKGKRFEVMILPLTVHRGLQRLLSFLSTVAKCISQRLLILGNDFKYNHPDIFREVYPMALEREILKRILIYGEAYLPSLIKIGGMLHHFENRVICPIPFLLGVCGCWDGEA